MFSRDSDYYRSRAEQEREAAERADQRYIAEIHLELARAYDALAKQPELRASLKVVIG